MFNHMDTLRTASFQIQLSGIKRWHICGPSENHKMYEASDVNAFAPDYDRYPLFLDADCYLDEVWHRRGACVQCGVPAVLGVLR
jgi:hypothetical protein